MPDERYAMEFKFSVGQNNNPQKSQLRWFNHQPAGTLHGARHDDVVSPNPGGGWREHLSRS